MEQTGSVMEMEDAELDVELCCGVFEQGSLFSAVVERGVKVEKLRDAIARVVGVQSHLLTLRLAWKEPGGWLKNSDGLKSSLMSGVDTTYAEMSPLCRLFRGDHGGKGYFSSDFTPGDEEVHVLVELPPSATLRPSDPGAVAATTKKPVVEVAADILSTYEVSELSELVAILESHLGLGNTPASDWFPEQMDGLSVTEMEGEETSYKYLKMTGFPPLAHPVKTSLKILERSCYRTIFDGLMEEVKQSLGRHDKNLVVEGNPGIGKSRFYVYCAFRLIRGLVDEDMTARNYTLVLNFGNRYLVYSWNEKVFRSIKGKAVLQLQDSADVLRLVEAGSSSLVGWNGVSILFTSPALGGLNDYMKGLNTQSFISPTWALAELRACNSILDEEQRLPDDEVESRYAKWGGNPRFIFGESQAEVNAKVASAIQSFVAQDVLVYLNRDDPVRADKYSHCVVAMVPTSPDFRTCYELEFVSKFVAAKVIECASDETLLRLVNFALDNEENNVGASLRGQLYEMFAHRWFSKRGCVVADEEKHATQSTRSVKLRVLDQPPVIQARPSHEDDAALEATEKAQAKSVQEKPRSGRCINQAPSSATKKSGGKRKAEPKPPSSRKTRRSATKADPKDEALCAQGEEKFLEDIRAHLAIQVPEMLEIPENLKSEWFDTLEDVAPSNAWTYYRPKSRIYAVDALIVELTPGTGKFAGNVYGLQMTMNPKHGIKANGAEKIVKWATSQGYTFVYVFVVPPKLSDGYKWQTIRTLKGAEHKRAGYLKVMCQSVMEVDPYFHYRPEAKGNKE